MLPRLARRALYPVLERSFTYSAYERMLDQLADPARFEVVPLREFASARSASRTVVGLRHDVDDRLDSAVELARREHDRGLRATYFILHTAGYWQREDLVETLLELQGWGHEIGWHNDLVTLECVYGGDARAFLAEQLAGLRAAGVAIEGSASHGSPYCYRFGYHNNAFFADFDDEELPGFSRRDAVVTPAGSRPVPRGRLAEFGFTYEAYHLDEDLYLSDASFDRRGRRWHPARLDLEEVAAKRRVIILTHPCHWDASVAAKVRRLPVAAVRFMGPGRKPAGAAA
jgi:hypothetical protein